MVPELPGTRSILPVLGELQQGLLFRAVGAGFRFLHGVLHALTHLVRPPAKTGKEEQWELMETQEN